jgi:hypothetical protein
LGTGDWQIVASSSLRTAGFAGAIAIHDPAFGQIVGRKFDVNSIAWKNFDMVPAQTSGDVR